MCSVIGYIGKALSRKFVLEGLSRLEYRGYDSAGFACIDSMTDRLLYAKVAGGLSSLQKTIDDNPINGFLGIGHTRWSTHGFASSENAHPHFNCDKTIAVMHNGIIENHAELRKILYASKMHSFHSQTDTEVINHLLEELLKQYDDFVDVLVALVHKLEGAYAVVSLMQSYSDRLVIIRKKSPLCIGIGQGEMFVASDPIAFGDKTKKVVFLPDESFAFVYQDTIQLYNFKGQEVEVIIQTLDLAFDAQEKGAHEHFMLKEIYEQKNAIIDTFESLETITDITKHLNFSNDYFQELETVNLIGCGSSWHAAKIAQFFFESIVKIPARIHLASEFRYMSFFPQQKSIYIGISQSGETADTLEAVNLINEIGLFTIAITNSLGSSLVRETQGYLLTRAGREIAVASTKAFTTQLITLYWFAHKIALEKGMIQQCMLEKMKKDIIYCATVLEETIEKYKDVIVQKYSIEFVQNRKVIFLGRHITYPFALEATLKLNEIAYIFAQCYPAGELKHGPLALIEQDIPVFVFSHQDPLIYKKLLSNVQEVKARRAKIIAFAFEGQSELEELADIYFSFPEVDPLLGPLIMTGLMQFFVYTIAKQLGYPIDKPRNLAKSVTVE